MCALELIDSWPVDHAAAAVVNPDGIVATYGPVDRTFPLASVTKPLSAIACLVAAEEGAIDLSDPVSATGPDVTVRHLLAHASGLAPETRDRAAAPGTRRIYSSAGFDILGEYLAAATGLDFPKYLTQAVCEPLGLSATTLNGSPAHAATSTVTDLARFARDLLAPTLVHPDTLAEATRVQFPGLSGVLPGFGRQEDNAWGLGLEIRNGKSPHWTGSRNSPGTFGHFGRSGTFLWVDPTARLATVVLTDRDFGPWAAEAWPVLSDAILPESLSARAQTPAS